VLKSLGISIKVGRILQEDWVMFSMGSADFHGGFHGGSLSYRKNGGDYSPLKWFQDVPMYV
jgi:hypothetical protein